MRDAAVIKSHHNVGGLPDFVDFKGIIEPLRMLFKDEVRQSRPRAGICRNIFVMRQPFQVPALRFASSVRSPRRNWICCVRRTLFSVTRL